MQQFLSPTGSYTGIDILDFAIEWCRDHISREHPNFTFVHANIFNSTYNPKGTVSPDRFEFPFPAATFSFVLATSLFTHLLPATMENYLSELSRVLAPEGRFLSTWFLLDEITERGMANGNPIVRFEHRFENHAQQSVYALKQAVAYRRVYVERIFSRAGLSIDSVNRGGWSGASSSVRRVRTSLWRGNSYSDARR